MAISNDFNILAIGFLTNRITLYHMKTIKEIVSVIIDDKPLALSFDHYNERLLVGGKNGEITVYKVDSMLVDSIGFTT